MPKENVSKIRWDLSDLYKSIRDPKIDKDITKVEDLSKDFSLRYRKQVAKLDGIAFLKSIKEYEKIIDIIMRLDVYAFLNWSTNTQDPDSGILLQKTKEFSSQISQELLFYDLEITKASDRAIKTYLNNPKVLEYKHWIDVSRRFKPYLLSEAEEKILTEKSVTGRSAWDRFFDEMHGGEEYSFEGKKHPLDKVLDKLHDEDRKIRKKANKVITDGLTKNIKHYSFIFNTLLADKASNDRLRKYDKWISSFNLSHEIKDDYQESLVEAVKAKYSTVHKYYDLKRKKMGLKKLYEYDRYAPLHLKKKKYSWEKAKKLVIDSYFEFHPTMGETAELFFKRNWIDAPLEKGKQGGAYCMQVPNHHPYLLLNFEGTQNDVRTMMHEMGHGIHGYLSKDQKILMNDAPLPMAELASKFGEMILFRNMMETEKDKGVRFALLASKIEDTIATVYRQISMHLFEDRVHNSRREEGELRTGDINQFWLETQREMFGESLEVSDDYGVWWSYIPHFFGSPGYVYSYAFGELVVMSLFAEYEKSNKKKFANEYIKLLSAGGSKSPEELLSPFGIKLDNPEFWNEGLEVIDGMVDSLINDKL